MGSDAALVEEIMSSDPPVIGARRPLREAAILMFTRQDSYVVVAETRKPLGILTARDLVVRVVVVGLDLDKLEVKDVMSTPVYTVKHKEPVKKAAELMAKYRVRRLVVVNDDGSLTGVLTLDSIARLLASRKGFEDPLLNALCQYSKPPSRSPYL